MNILSNIKKSPMLLAIVVLVVIVGVYFLFASKLMGRENFNGADAKLVMYYADWCGHCKTTKPEFKKLGKTQKVNGKTVAIEMVNGDSNPQAVEKAGVRGFPTIHLIHKNGKRTEFQGNRKASNFKQFLKDHVKSRGL